MNILLILSVACLAVGLVSVFISNAIRNEIFDRIEKIEDVKHLQDEAFLKTIGNVDYTTFQSSNKHIWEQLTSHAQDIEDTTKKVNEYIATRYIDNGEEIRLKYAENGNWRIADKERDHEL